MRRWWGELRRYPPVTCPRTRVCSSGEVLASTDFDVLIGLDFFQGTSDSSFWLNSDIKTADCNVMCDPLQGYYIGNSTMAVSGDVKIL